VTTPYAIVIVSVRGVGGDGAMTVVGALWREAGRCFQAVLRVAADIGVWVIGTLIIAVVTAGFARADPALPDPGSFNIDLDPATASGPRAPKQLYTFGVPYTWSGSLNWRYNDAGRPTSISKTDVIAGINAAAGQWMAACKVTIAQASDTTTPPQTINGTAPSSNENVIGWGNLAIPPKGGPNLSGVTYTSSRQGALVDADTTFSTTWITNPLALRRVAVHELGHAIGLAHSNVEGQVMSGPVGSNNPGVPDTPYNSLSTLQVDDIQGCLCLYGPSVANAGQGFLCDLPSHLEFGSTALGTTSGSKAVTLTNDAKSGNVVIGQISMSAPDFRYTGGCYPGTTLAPGQSCTFGIAFAPIGTAGSRIGYAQIATGTLGPYRFPLTGTASGAPPRNYEGLWWNAPAASEPGWGVNFAHQGDTLFVTWFTYDNEGKPLWFAAVAQKQSGDVYSGELFTATGPAFNAVPFKASSVLETTVGSATFSFSDVNHGTFAWNVDGVAQTKAITRQIFASAVPTCTFGAQANLALASNHQGLWWNFPANSEAGWGMYVTQQGDTLFITWYTYGLDGQPMWLIALARPIAPNVYSGPISTVTGPSFAAAPFDPSRVVETEIGTATLTFIDGNNGSFAYSVNGIAQTKEITRQVFVAPGTVCQ